MSKNAEPVKNTAGGVFSTFVLVCWLATSITGCTNSPKAIELRVSAETLRIQPDDVLHLRAHLVVKKGPVCLEPCYRIAAEVERLEPEPLSMQQPARWICGTPFLAETPLVPFILPIALLDVADGLHRFEVLRQDDERTHELFIACERVVVDEPRLSVSKEAGDVPAHAPWPPGRYCVRVHMDNEWLSPYPPPLFWRPYDQPVAADLEFLVVEQ